jgi:peptidoglycan/LPS O-acetylase OafA/YrhL
MKQSTSNFLNFSRWMAAFLVVLSHARSITLVDYQQVNEKNTLVQLLYFVSGLGHEAVVVFFVISGFLVGGTTLDSWKTEGVDIRAYVAARVSRIYTVLVPALIVGGTLDLLGMCLFNQAGFYSTPAAIKLNSLNFTGQTGLSLDLFITNLLQMQGIWTATYGTNGPLWSLAYECWYYFLFASLVGFYLETDLVKKIAFSAAAMLAICLLPNKVLLWGFIWATGVATFKLLNTLRANLLTAAAIFFIVLTASRLNLGHKVIGTKIDAPEWLFLKDFVLGISYSMLLIAVNQCDFSWCKNQNKILAEFSYSLYVYHFPALVFFSSLMFTINPTEVLAKPHSPVLVRLMLLCIATVFLSFSLAQITERYTPQVRRWLTKK